MLEFKIIEFILKYEETFTKIETGYRTKPHFFGDEWYALEKLENSWSVIKVGERGNRIEKYKGAEIEVLLYTLMLVVDRREKSDFMQQRDKYEEQIGHDITASESTYEELMQFMNEIGIDKECYSTENHLVKNTFMIIMNGETGSFYSVVGNECAIEERTKITKEDKSAFNSLLVTAHHKTVLKRLKESLEKEGINLSDYPSEISEVISPKSTFYRD